MRTLVIGLLASAWTLAVAQGPAPKWSARVQIDVTGDRPEIGAEIQSYFGRELRSLGDISVVDTKPDYKVQIVALENQNRLLQPIGVTLSIVVTQTLGSVVGISTPPLPPTAQNFDVLLDHWVQVGGPGELRSMCERAVNKMDSTHFQLARGMFQAVQDLLEGTRRRQ